MKSGSPLADELDPYLELNEKVEAALAGIEIISKSIETSESKEDFTPSLMKSVVGVLKDLSKTLRDVASREIRPNITVETPEITMPAPEITVNNNSPKEWVCKVKSRDAAGRIDTFSIKAV